MKFSVYLTIWLKNHFSNVRLNVPKILHKVLCKLSKFINNVIFCL